MITLSLWALMFSDLFGSQLGSLVVQADREISATEKYENIVVLNGELRLFGEAENLVLIGGKAILEDGSKTTNLVLFRGTVEQKDNAEVLHLKGKGDFALFDFWAWAKNFSENWKKYLSSTFNWTWDVDTGLVTSILFYVLLFFSALLFLGIPGLGPQSSLQIFQSIGACLIVGILFLLSIIPITLRCVFSIVGILFIPFVAFAYVAFLWLGFFVSARALGAGILFPVRIRSNFICLLLGLAILVLIARLQDIGFWIGFFASLIGVGAFLRGLFKTRVYMASA